MVDAGELAEASEVYHGKPGEKGGQRTLKSGKELKILALESQSDVNYIMPWRIMDYDCREYGKQIRGAQRANRELDRAGKRVYAKEGGTAERSAERGVFCAGLYIMPVPWGGGVGRPQEPEGHDGFWRKYIWI